MTTLISQPETMHRETSDPANARARTAMGWIHVVSHLDPKFGGLSAAVPELARSVARVDGRVARVAAFCGPDEVAEADGIAVTRWPTSRMAWMRDRSVRSRFEDLVRNAAGVHIHGLWETSTAMAVRSARAVGKPYVLSAHGMLEPWALGNKRLKKQIYGALVERGNVAGANCLHALTEAEVEDYRRFGGQQPAAVIPNGVEIPEGITEQVFLERWPELRGKRLVLFLGRIHFKKGLDLLVDAWVAITKRFPDAHLVLAGPDFEGTQATVEQRIRERGVEQTVTITGMLAGDSKWSAMRAATAFVLPSYSEGLSVSALEAMGMGLPVILTTHCHLPEAARAGAGWEIAAEVQALEAALTGMLEQTADMNRAMGERGRALVRTSYSWGAIGAAMSQVYGWLEGGPMPNGAPIAGMYGDDVRKGGPR